MRGLLFVVSAPSGTGKTTLVERLVERTPNLFLSRSYTSRPARAGEADGVDYNFISRQNFEQMREANGFLECAEVFGNWYGTGQADTEKHLAADRDLVLVIDVQGARQARSKLETIGIFVLPPSFAVLEQRLRGRSKDSEADIRRRLEVAREEVSAFGDYDYVVINDDIDTSTEALRSIVVAERARLRVMRPIAEKVIATFKDKPKES